MSVVSDQPTNACSLGVIIIGIIQGLLPLGDVMINRCAGFSSFPSITWTVCSMSDVLRADNQSLFLNSFCCTSPYIEPLKDLFSDLCFSVICFAYTALSTSAKLKTLAVPMNA